MNIIDVLSRDLSTFLRTILITLIILLAAVRVSQLAGFIKEVRGRKEYIQDIKLGVLSKKDLLSYSPYEFEHWCSEFLEKQGFTDIFVTPCSQDGGKDIVCRKGADTYYVECKRYSYSKDANLKVDLEIVRKLVGAMEVNGVKNGMFITTGYAANEALNYIYSLPKEYKLQVIDGDEIIRKYTDVKHLVYVEEKS